ncbi:MAG: LCP family protein [Candidatus Woesebacteria bacterium]|nr:LCP family protein [Candidatus Woesebacteria bacterium]
MHKRYFIIILGAILVALYIFAAVFIKRAESKIKSQDGRVNVLILGKGGLGHAGADLTDTMMLASVSLAKHSVNLISIPRDIWIPEIRAKVNSAYYWGKEKPEFGGGLSFAKKNVEAIVGIPVNYALVLDFSSFKGIIDALGGVEIDVANSFTDNLYPIEGREEDTCGGDKEFKCRYETIYFEKGVSYMDGTTALKYVRSRNGDNDENTDIAREARQQKVISAIKSKILSKGTLLNPFKLYKVWKVVRSSIETDMDFFSMIVLGREMLNVDGNIQSSAIPEGLLINPPESQKYDYQYVFTPKVAGNWGEFQNWIKDLIK